MYRLPGFVVSSISHPSQPGLEGDCSAGDIGGGDNSDSRAAIGELGGGDSRAAIGEPEVLGGAERGKVEFDQEHTVFGVRSWRRQMRQRSRSWLTQDARRGPTRR